MSKTADNEQLVRVLQMRLNQRGEALKLDGHGGPSTMAALDRRLPDLVPTPSPATPAAGMTLSARHYTLAREYLGLREQPGGGTHPLLVPMFALTPSWLDRDDSKTAWCGIFRGWLGHRASTGLPAEHYRAASWATWGRAVDLSKPVTWQRGDTIIMTRPGGSHVCLLDRVEGQHAWCLGGNQDNAVTIARFALSRITAVRR